MASSLYLAKPKGLMDYLGNTEVKPLSIKVSDSPYAKYGAAEVEGTNIYLILADNTDESWAPLGYIFKKEEAGRAFFRFVQDWKTTGVDWYRGFGIAHFSYPGLLNDGLLWSEGQNDIPKSTMSDKTSVKKESKTLWLPGYQYTSDGCVGIACGTNSCPYTGALLSQDREMPLGLIVHAKLGKDYCNRKVAWLYDGEAVVQGPISHGVDFDVFQIGGYFGGKIKALNVPASLPRASLPPARPYHEVSTQQHVQDWYNNQCVPWLNRAVTTGADLLIQQGTPTAFASTSTASSSSSSSSSSTVKDSI